jgi:hypothetical protein
MMNFVSVVPNRKCGNFKYRILTRKIKNLLEHLGLIQDITLRKENYGTISTKQHSFWIGLDC